MLLAFVVEKVYWPAKIWLLIRPALTLTLLNGNAAIKVLSSPVFTTLFVAFVSTIADLACAGNASVAMELKAMHRQSSRARIERLVFIGITMSVRRRHKRK